MTHRMRPLLLGCAAIVVSATAAGVETWSYNPESCAVGADGKLYIRMPGGYEFAFRVDAPMQLGSPVEALQDLQLDASEPEGCFREMTSPGCHVYI